VTAVDQPHSLSVIRKPTRRVPDRRFRTVDCRVLPAQFRAQIDLSRAA